MKDKLTAVYYTGNWLEEHNPYFLANTRKNLVKSLKNIPLLVVSHKPTPRETFPGYEGEYTNLVAGRDFKLYKEGRHHFNIYKQIQIGAENAKTPYFACVEDDIFYSESHFYSREIKKLIDNNTQKCLFDMNKVSLFTWTNPPMYSFRSKRRVVNQLIAPSKMIADAMQERFDRIPVLLEKGWTEERITSFWGDPSRYEKHLGVTELPYYEWFSQVPSVVWTHPEAYGFLNHGTRKRLGDIRIIELYDWGKASDMLKLWGEQPLK